MKEERRLKGQENKKQIQDVNRKQGKGKRKLYRIRKKKYKVN